MHAEDAGKTAAQEMENRWDRIRARLIQAGAQDGEKLTDELLLFLYFAGHAAVHIALFDNEKLRNRVQVGYSLGWEEFARKRSSTVHSIAEGRLQAYTSSLQNGQGAASGGSASAVAGSFCGFLGCDTPSLQRVSAILFDEQLTATMGLIRDQRSRGLQ